MWTYAGLSDSLRIGLVTEERVVLRDDGELVVLDARDGGLLWRERVASSGFGTRVGSELVYAITDDRVHAFDLETGEEFRVRSAADVRSYDHMSSGTLRELGGRLVLVRHVVLDGLERILRGDRAT